MKALFLCIAAAALTGCAALPSGDNATWFDVGLGYQPSINGFGETHDTAKAAVEHAWSSGHYVRFEHISHLGDNRVHEETLNHVVVGYRFRASKLPH